MRRPVIGLRSAILTALLAVGASLVLVPGLCAQAGRTSASAEANHLVLFPPNDRWRALVIGDGLASGLLGGLASVMRGERRMILIKPRKQLVSLVRVNLDYELRRLATVLAQEKVHIAIFMLGLQDRYGVWLSNGRRLRVGDPQWRKIYGERVDKVVQFLRSRGIAVYWVGLPILAREDWSASVEGLNAVFRQRVVGNGGRFIDIYNETADANGRYNPRGPDLAGNYVRLRDYEGVYFTGAGYQKLAYFAQRVLQRDMTRARDEREIPLAGDVDQQRRLRDTVANSNARRSRAGNAGRGGRGSPLEQVLPPGQRLEKVKVSFKAADSGGGAQQVTMTIVRPALPSSIVSLIARRYTGNRPRQVGDTITDTLSNGLMLMRSITPSVNRLGSSGQPTATSQPFFIALARGERLKPKPGRADDFRWPRTDDLPPPPDVEVKRSAISSPVRLDRRSSRRRVHRRQRR